MSQKSSGFSLVGILVAIAVSSIAFMAISDLYQQIFKAQRGLEVRAELMSLKNRLMLEIDCASTLTGVNPMTQCTPTNYLTLRNKAGNPISTTAGTGAFANSVLIEGLWYVRTTCDNTNQTLVVQVARRGRDMNTFSDDPQTSQTFNWTYLKGQVYGPNAHLCGVELGAPGGGGGPSNFTRGNLANSGSQCMLGYSRDDDGNPTMDGRVWSGTVLCAAGQTARSGQVDCSTSNNRSLTTSSFPTPTENGWSGGCCVSTSSSFDGTNRIAVTCQ